VSTSSSPGGSADNTLTAIVALVALAVVLLVAMVVLTSAGRQSGDGDSSTSSGLTCQRYGDC
jgi:hypothetical protein